MTKLIQYIEPIDYSLGGLNRQFIKNLCSVEIEVVTVKEW